jgi:hypothetical protein
MNDRGIALILVLLVMMTLSAIGMSLALLVSTEARVAAAYRDGLEVSYGAEAALQRVLPDLAAEPALDRALAGLAMSSFVDGPPGTRRLPDGTFMDLHTLTAMMTCGLSVCRDADLDDRRVERPWGSNNPRWQLYGYGGDSRVYAVVWIADDSSETDGDPFIDGGGVDNPGRGRLSITVHGYGFAGTRRIVEATVSIREHSLTLLSWREIR